MVVALKCNWSVTRCADMFRAVVNAVKILQYRIKK